MTNAILSVLSHNSHEFLLLGKYSFRNILKSSVMLQTRVLRNSIQTTEEKKSVMYKQDAQAT